MEQILNTLGFTDLPGICWNTLAYIGMVMIIVAVVSARLRNQFFVWGPLLLLLYAWFYLYNPILAALQSIILVSGVFNLLHIKKPTPYIVTALAVIAYMTLLLTGQISGLWPWIGSFGLLGIAFGMIQLPKKRGFALMALGGALIVVYALALEIWVFFVLNLVFFIVNILELRRK